MTEQFMHAVGASAVLALIAAAAACLFLIGTQHWHGRFSFDTADGAQKFHIDPTSRIGGVGIVIGVIAGFLVAREAQMVLWPLLLAGIPAFAAGLAEDITKRVGVSARLCATIGSGILICLLTGTAIGELHLPVLDSLLTYAWFAIPFTALALAGVANALNIIDGFNGLAGGVAAIVLLAFAALALTHGDTVLAAACIIFAAAMLGFLVLNFPLGRIFLGDGGAYFVGFALAWLAILLVTRHPEISPWAVAAIVAYPVVEMLYSIWRKHRREGHHPSRPDGLHMHMLVHRRVVRKLFPHASRRLQNGLTAPFCWLLALPPVLVAVMRPHDTTLLMGSVIAFILFYSVLYARLTQFRWCLRPLTLARAPRVVG
ncbi:MAG: glycosyltransferase family 4 protein [Gammaproteobacteria bacterium]|nr:glycosyltransferase family 4 protein [Gammaproteobacteria bacterium]